MKKDLITHFSFLVAFFIFISIFHKWLSLDFVSFWLGGLLGTILPYADHYIYIYFLRPDEAASKEAAGIIAEKKYVKSLDLLTSTRNKRSELIFHTAYFQLIFLALTFLVVTSSGSLFGRGLVLAFSLHLLVSQAIDLTETNNLDNWFKKVVVITDDKQRRWYLVANLAALLVIGFLM